MPPKAGISRAIPNIPSHCSTGEGTNRVEHPRKQSQQGYDGNEEDSELHAPCRKTNTHAKVGISHKKGSLEEEKRGVARTMLHIEYFLDKILGIVKVS